MVKEEDLVKAKTLDFIITGPPRSRMAWIANYLTYGNMFCKYDALRNGLKNMLLRTTELDGSLYYGIADSGAVHYQQALIEQHPNAKWILITRPYKEVVRSFRRLGYEADDRVTKIYDKIGELKASRECLEIPFHKVADEITNIAHYVNPNWSCPPERHEMLLELNVQINPPTAHKIYVDHEGQEPPRPIAASKEYFELMAEICKGNQEALLFVHQAVEAALVFDHIKDQDPIDQAMTDRTLEALTMHWPLNSFVRNNAPFLVSAMSRSIEQWRSGSDDYAIYKNIGSAVMFAIGGQPMVDANMVRLRYIVEQGRIEDNQRDL